jgi:hypothetical protein
MAALEAVYWGNGGGGDSAIAAFEAVGLAAGAGGVALPAITIPGW